MLRGISKAISDCRVTRESLQALLLDSSTSCSVSAYLKTCEKSSDIDSLIAIVSPNELNNSHGTGVLINRIFPNSSGFFSIRSFDHYGGVQSFGAKQIRLRHEQLTRSQSFKTVLRAVGDSVLSSIFLIPYHEDEWLTALVLKHSYKIPLAVYIMDDTVNLFSKVDYALVKEVLDLADVCFAISREMAESYESRFGVKFWVVPPVVPSESICKKLFPAELPANEAQSQGVLIGNAWCPLWLERLGQALLECNKHVDWYGGGFNKQHDLDIDKLDSCNIHYKGFMPSEYALSLKLRDYAFLLVPSAALGDVDQFDALASLSLPSRIPFALSTANLPTLVLQDRVTAAGTFVQNMGVGLTSRYSEIAAGIETILQPENQNKYRENASRIAPSLSNINFDDWMLKSIAQKEAFDDRFEKLLPRQSQSVVQYNDWNVPTDLYGDFTNVHLFFRRLKRYGYKPDFIIDVGASIGTWSNAVHRVFSDARFILVEPLLSQYDKQAIEYNTGNRGFEFLELALSDTEGITSFNVSSDLYGSSLVKPNDFRTYKSVPVKICRLDTVAEDLQIAGRGVLKLDVQYAEHTVLAGATTFINQIDIVIIEVGMVRKAAGAKLLDEFMQIMQKLNFEYFDDLGGWRDPMSGFLTEKDVAFVRTGVIERAW